MLDFFIITTFTIKEPNMQAASQKYVISQKYHCDTGNLLEEVYILEI